MRWVFHNEDGFGARLTGCPRWANERDVSLSNQKYLNWIVIKSILKSFFSSFYLKVDLVSRMNIKKNNIKGV